MDGITASGSLHFEQCFMAVHAVLKEGMNHELCDQRIPRQTGFTSAAAWSNQYFEPKPDDSKQCKILMSKNSRAGLVREGGNSTYFVRCEMTYVSGTSSSSRVMHLKTAHGIDPPRDLGPISAAAAGTPSVSQWVMRQSAVASGRGIKRPSDCTMLMTDAVVLAHVFNPNVPFEVANNRYWKSAYGIAYQDTQIGCSRSLKEHIMSFYDRLLDLQKKTLRGIVGIQMDAGKDIRSRKLHATAYMHPTSRRSLVYNLVDTDNEVLDEAWHHQYITNTVEGMMRDHAVFVPSVTVDNEASQNAGITVCLNTTLMWLLHFRCGCHSIELLLCYIRENLPPTFAKIPAENANAVVSAVRNHKVLSKALKDLQTAANTTPYILVKSCNTRKWSSDFLVASRLLKLQRYVSVMYTNEEYSAMLPPEPDWTALAGFVKMLFPFYTAEQILQRDSSHAIHYAYFWSRCHQDFMSILGGLLTARPAPTHEDRLAINACERKVQKRDQKVRECGVFHLCLMLWPDPAAVTNSGWQLVLRELRFLVDKQWEQWLRHSVIVQLPPDVSTKDAFLDQCNLELTEHRAALSQVVLGARESFRTHVSEVLAAMEASSDIAKPAKAKLQNSIWCSSVDVYWRKLHFSLPSIHFIYRLLSHCCATESGTERMFSSEKQIHNTIRNGLSPNVVRAIIGIRWNYEALMLGTGAISEPDTQNEQPDWELVQYPEEE